MIQMPKGAEKEVDGDEKKVLKQTKKPFKK